MYGRTGNLLPALQELSLTCQRVVDVSPPDIIFSSPSQPGPAGHPVSLVSAFPLTYTFPYLLS